LSACAGDKPRRRPNADHRAKTETIQGFNIRRWGERGLNYWAVSDLGAD
jgi:hypothetical protein